MHYLIGLQYLGRYKHWIGLYWNGLLDWNTLLDLKYTVYAIYPEKIK